MPDTNDNDRLRRLMGIGRRLLGQLDPDVVLRQILEEARTITGARYAALGVLTEDRTEIERFITLGIDEATHRAIGGLPRGRGVLGVLIEDPRPLRLKAVGDHPQSFGFPAGHPPMGTFLGVPIVIGDRAWGNLYLTEKEAGQEFTEADEDAALVLAQFAATAIENARLYQRAEHGRQQLQRAVRGLEAARNIADAIGAESDLKRVLELIAKRGRALIEATTVLILLRDGDDLVVAAGAGAAAKRQGRRLGISGSAAGRVLETGVPARVSDVLTEMPMANTALKVGAAKTGLVVPMTHRGIGLGVLMAFDRGPEQVPFTADDEYLMGTFAASAANAVAMSRTVESGRLRSMITATEEERRRWARELHDQTLQALGGLRVLLSSSSRQESLEKLREVVGHAVADIDQEITNLRAIISDLRPSLLDDLGLEAALDALIQRRRGDGLEITAEISVAGTETEAALPPELETTVYRLVQEALTNVVKHAHATAVSVRIGVESGTLVVEVSDDGTGFDENVTPSGFGLTGIRERIYLADGTVSVDSETGGTTLHARIPLGLDVALGNLGVKQSAA